LVLFLLLFLVGGLGGALVFTWTSRPESGSATPPADPVSQTIGAEPALPLSAEGPADGTPPLTGGPVAGSLEAANEQTFASRETAITRAAKRAGESVVTVGVIQTRLVRGAPRVVDPFDLFFNRYLPGSVHEQRIPSMGSGIIVDAAGIILTNHHVVQNATKIEVILRDGRTFPARLIGSDPNWDLAALKVDGADLPAAEIGDSDELVVGEWAIAIGNPFGFYIEGNEPTVTVGVISALHRDIKGDDVTQGIYKDMIQTDAAINPGNSGGALVNALGQVIGINTFIFTPGGGNVGIGFAIPIKTAVRVARDLIRYGRERPVWIGFYARPIGPWMAGELGLERAPALIVSLVEAGSPADRAGLQEYDVIREINGKRVSSAAEANRTIFGVQPGDEIAFTIERRGERRVVRVRVENVPGSDGAREP